VQAVRGEVCADLPSAAGADLSENSRQGFETKKSALFLGFELRNSTTALGIAGTLALEGVRKNDRARYYSPIFRRFISEDPAGFAGGVNFYAYVGNSPTNGAGPMGLWSTAAHDQIIWNALHPCGVSNADIWQIQQGSHFVDENTGALWLW